MLITGFICLALAGPFALVAWGTHIAITEVESRQRPGEPSRSAYLRAVGDLQADRRWLAKVRLRMLVWSWRAAEWQIAHRRSKRSL